MRHLAPIAVVISLSSHAAALEPGAIGGDEVHVDVTDASSVLYNVDNRDSTPGDVSSRANDDWGMWYNRLNVQASWNKWQLGLRVDNAWFYRSPYPETIALDITRTDPVVFRQKFDAAGRELSTRYINWVYPAKYYVGYTTRDVEVTAGDFYAALGRGFVLSVRKLDELSSDTTVRGGRITGRVSAGDTKLRMTLLGGEMNPLRIDEASGRYLGVDSSVTPSWLGVTEAGMPRAVETDFVPVATPTYAPDRLVAAQFEIAPKGMKFGTQGSLLVRQDALGSDVVRQADSIMTASQSIEVPDFDGHGDAYLEVGYQNLDDGHTNPNDNPKTSDLLDPGYALYASTTLIQLPVSVTLEGKHYRRFFPLRANVDPVRAKEFGLVQYSAPPTTEAFYVDTEFGNFNTCVSGGRVKTDVSLGKDESVFAWAGHYYTWAESVTNEECDTSTSNLNRVWDLATGFELTGDHNKSRATFSVGGRLDSADALLSTPTGTTHLYYRETYARYDIIRWLGGPFSLQLQGWHRRRHEVAGGTGDPWFEGQHLTGLDWAPHLSVAFGTEYSSNPSVPSTYFNGQVTYKITPASSVGVFVGQRRGALRCVGGVCRVFPPFEGARLDATVRF